MKKKLECCEDTERVLELVLNVEKSSKIEKSCKLKIKIGINYVKKFKKTVKSYKRFYSGML